MNPRCVLVLACALVACGRATTRVEMTAKSPRPLRAVSPDRVSVLRTVPMVPYVEVALLRAREGTFGTEPDELIAKLRADAAEIGCDAVLVEGPTSEVRWIGTPPTPVRFAVYSGSCLVFVAPSDASAVGSRPTIP